MQCTGMESVMFRWSSPTTATGQTEFLTPLSHQTAILIALCTGLGRTVVEPLLAAFVPLLFGGRASAPAAVAATWSPTGCATAGLSTTRWATAATSVATTGATLLITGGLPLGPLLATCFPLCLFRLDATVELGHPLVCGHVEEGANLSSLTSFE